VPAAVVPHKNRWLLWTSLSFGALLLLIAMISNENPGGSRATSSSPQASTSAGIELQEPLTGLFDVSNGSQPNFLLGNKNNLKTPLINFGIRANYSGATPGTTSIAIRISHDGNTVSSCKETIVTSSAGRLD